VGHMADVGNAGTYLCIPVFLVVPHVKSTDNFRMNTGMVDTAPLIIWLL
jgi:hypothetical protein